MGELYKELFDYSTLETAYEGAFEYLSGEIEDEEEWIINLQNHLIWRTYEPGEDPDMDCVVLTAISNILKSHGLRVGDLQEPELRRIIEDLTLN